MAFLTQIRITFAALLVAVLLPLTAQQTGKGNLQIEPEDKLLATERATDDVRAMQFKRALALYGQEDYEGCRRTIDSIAHDASGALIVDSLSGLAYHMAGMTYYQLYDDLNAAPQYLKAISIRDACYPGIHYDQAHTRYNLANSMHWLGRPDTATYLLREAIDIYDRLERKDSTNWLRSLKLLGVIAKESNDPDLVRSATVAMVNLLESMHAPTALDRYQVRYDAAVSFQYLGDFPASTRNGQDAVAAGFALTKVMPPKEAVSMAADAVNIIASNYRFGGDNERAVAGYDRSLHLLDSIGGDPTSINIVYSNLAELYFAQGENERALTMIEKAEQYPFNEDYLDRKSETYVIHGNVLSRLGRKNEALSNYTKAMKALVGDAVTEDDGYSVMLTDSMEYLEGGFFIYASRAEMLLAADEPQAALADLRRLFALQNLQRQRVNSNNSRYLLTEKVRTYYDRAIDLLYHLHAENKDEQLLWDAFALSEESKAYSQLAAVRGNKILAGRKEQDLRREIALLEREVAQNADEAVALADTKVRLSLLLRSEQRADTSEVPPFRREALAAYLKDLDLEILEFHLNEQRTKPTDPASYLFHLTPAGAIRMLRLDVDPALRGEIDTWRDAIRASAYRTKRLKSDQDKLDADYLAGGQGLRDVLLPGFTSGTLSLGPHLCIIPDGSLNFLPFAALPLSAASAPVDYGKLEYLQTGRSLQLAFSVQYLLELKKRAPIEYKDDLLAFAPSFRGEATPGEVSELRGMREANSVRLNERTILPGLLPLSHNRSEVAAIVSLVPSSQVYYDEAATREAFLSTLGASRILHLSSHGMVDAEEASLSFVAFSQAGEDLEESELLYFNDLSTLPLDAEMVVLSACETSLGRLVPGESVLSLGSAFAAAGARSTLTALWKVDDAATEDLVVGFYEELTAGKSRAEALAAAQNRQREDGEYAHPYYWSAMTINGAAGPIALKPAAAPWWLYVLAALSLGALFYFGFRKGH